MPDTPPRAPEARPLDLEKLERLARAVAPEPWAVRQDGRHGAVTDADGRLMVVAGESGRWWVVCRVGNTNLGVYDPTQLPRAEFIAACDPPTVLTLLAELDALRRRLDAVEGAAQPFAEMRPTWDDTEDEKPINGNCEGYPTVGDLRHLDKTLRREY